MDAASWFERLGTFSAAVADRAGFWVGLALMIEPYLERAAPEAWQKLREFLARRPDTRRKIFQGVGAVALIFACFQVWDAEYLRRVKVERDAAGAQEARWAPLTEAQRVTLVARLRQIAPQSLWIACETLNCRDLADGLGAAFHDAQWSEVEVHHWGGWSVAGALGISIEPDEQTTHLIKDAIEAAAPTLHVKIESITREQHGASPALLVVGTKPF